MVSKNTGRCLAYGIAMSALALAPMVQAQDTVTMSSSTSMSGSMMQPMQVTGQVLRYYVDRSGYVTAMDVQTPNGVQMVRFAPGMGQRLYSTYPVGGQASVYVVGSPGFGGTTNYTVVGLGDTIPAAGFMTPYTVSDIDLLKSEPYIMAGSRMVQFTGRLRSIVTDETGEVIGLVLDGVKRNLLTGGTMANTTMTDGTMGGGTMADWTVDRVLVRVPREVRHFNTNTMGGSMRTTPLFRGALVEVVGWPEAPRFGVLSNVAQRIAASALVVDGRAVGAMGIPRMSQEASRSLFNLDLAPNSSEEERRAMQMGYTTYDPTGGAHSMSGTAPNTGGANTGTIPVQ